MVLGATQQGGLQGLLRQDDKGVVLAAAAPRGLALMGRKKLPLLRLLLLLLLLLLRVLLQEELLRVLCVLLYVELPVLGGA